jgi:site-specific DNA-methyltransferase (adenine-specific)
MSRHNSAVVSYPDGRDDITGGLISAAKESYRILRPDRFGVFFFGFNYYKELLSALQGAGFRANPVPVIWFKHTRSTENPNTRYANAYDPAIVAMKGSPVFIRPGQANVIDMPAVTPSERIQIAQQPVALVEKFIRDMVAPGALVVDLMAGSGTTGVAALQCKCRVILFEREPAACAVIKARLGAL